MKAQGGLNWRGLCILKKNKELNTMVWLVKGGCLSGMCLKPIICSHCFSEPEVLTPMLSTGWFQELIQKQTITNLQTKSQITKISKILLGTTYYLPWNSSDQELSHSCTYSGHKLHLCKVSSVVVYLLGRSCAYKTYWQTDGQDDSYIPLQNFCWGYN